MTDRHSLAENDLLAALREKMRQTVGAGVDWIQIREKDLGGRALFDLTKAAVRIARESSRDDVRTIVNDRADVAIAAGASGVHLGGNSAPLQELVARRRRAAVPKDFVIGVSCHSAGDIRQAEQEGADYAFLGPVFDTPSKRTYGEPLGVATLAEVCRSSKIPVIAIGGIDHRSIAECLETGAAGIAAIRMFQAQDAVRVRDAVEEIHRTMR